MTGHKRAVSILLVTWSSMPRLSCLAGLAPEQLGYVAVHGTGTPLGDPIEMGALGQAASRLGLHDSGPLAVGSVKSCYGHTEGCAGLTGSLLAIQSLQQQVQPFTHCGTYCCTKQSSSLVSIRIQETAYRSSAHAPEQPCDKCPHSGTIPRYAVDRCLFQVQSRLLSVSVSCMCRPCRL